MPAVYWSCILLIHQEWGKEKRIRHGVSTLTDMSLLILLPLFISLLPNPTQDHTYNFTPPRNPSTPLAMGLQPVVICITQFNHSMWPSSFHLNSHMEISSRTAGQHCQERIWHVLQSGKSSDSCSVLLLVYPGGFLRPKTPFIVAAALRNLRDAAQTGPATSGTTGNAPV